MTRSRLRRPRGDQGVYAVLFALLVVVLFVTAALVVDISAMRESRREVRSATDSAVTAAASALNLIDPSKADPRGACDKAWEYLADALEDVNYADRRCGLPLPDNSTTCPATPVNVPIVTSGIYKVRFVWPVEDGNSLLVNPDVAPGNVPQAAVEAFDGHNDDRCARLGLEVWREVDFTLATAFAGSGASIRSASVSRATKVGDGRPVIGALNVLEPTLCDALLVSGQGSLVVRGQGDAAGVLAIESDGREGSSGRCPNNRPDVLDVKDANNDHNFVRVDGPAGPGRGVIEQYALWRTPIGNPNDAYDRQDLTQGTPVRLQPRPTILDTPTGAKPVTDKYDCTVARGCDVDPTATYVSNLVTAYGSGTPGTYLAAQSPYGTAPFATLPGPGAPTFQCNMPSSYVSVTVPAGNWFINCPSGLAVSNVLIFQGGNIVTAGGVDVRSGGCLAVNVPATSCPTANTVAVPKTTNPAPLSDSIMYLRSGNLTMGGQASLFLPQTFVYIANGHIDMVGDPNLLWTTPLGTDCLGGEPCMRARFVRLCLWSESTQTHELGGQATLNVRGVFFIPSALFDYSGQGDQDMDDAQFWVKRMSIGGQGTLTMSADPTAAVERYTSGVLLIR